MLINSPRAHIARQFKITGLEVLVMFIGRYYNPDLITANTRREHIRVGIMGTADLFHTKRRYVQGWLDEDGLPPDRVDQAMEIIRTHRFPLARHQLVPTRAMIERELARCREKWLFDGLCFREETA